MSTLSGNMPTTVGATAERSGQRAVATIRGVSEAGDLIDSVEIFTKFVKKAEEAAQAGA